MSVREILLEFLEQQVDPDVRGILADVLVAEQRKIDMKLPRRIKEDIREIIDAKVRAEEREQ